MVLFELPGLVGPSYPAAALCDVVPQSWLLHGVSFLLWVLLCLSLGNFC